MTRQAWAIVAVLGVLAIGLTIALGVTLAMRGDDDHDGMMMSGQAGYAGMMGAMGSSDSEAMLQHMKEVLGADGFARMQQHLSDHQGGGPMTGNPQIDQMMHSMMDGMMGQMPGLTTPDPHHPTPGAPAASPTPAR